MAGLPRGHVECNCESAYLTCSEQDRARLAKSIAHNHLPRASRAYPAYSFATLAVSCPSSDARRVTGYDGRGCVGLAGEHSLAGVAASLVAVVAAVSSQNACMRHSCGLGCYTVAAVRCVRVLFSDRVVTLR